MVIWMHVFKHKNLARNIYACAIDTRCVKYFCYVASVVDECTIDLHAINY